MEREELKAVIENVLFAADQPVSVGQLQDLFAETTEKAVLKSALDELVREYQSRNLQLMEVAEGYQLMTRHDYSDWVRKFMKLDKTAKLSQPSLDALAIIAYKQPLTKAEVEEIRGVDSSGVVRTLLEKKVIAPSGRKKVPGRPIMYRTTRKFLEYFGLMDLNDLPTLEDFKESELTEGQDQSDQISLTFDDQALPGDAEGEAQPVEPSDPDASSGS
jgi:segregation and condensation protein B